MIAFFAACTAGCTTSRSDDCPGGGNLRGAGKSPARRLLLSETEGADDDEDAAIEGWMKKSSSFTRWLWNSRFFRLEQGPRLLSFYRSQIWQGCRRDGAYDLTCLVGVNVVRQRNTQLVLEFSSSSAQAGSEKVEIVRLRVPSGVDTAREWERHLVEFIEGQLLEACEQCSASELAVDRAVQILRQRNGWAAEGRANTSVDRRRQEGSNRTALMLVAQAGHERLCTLLLDAKADPGLRDSDGKTAPQLAEAAGHGQAACLLTVGFQPLFPDAHRTALGRAAVADDDVLIKKAAAQLDRVPTPARM